MKLILFGATGMVGSSVLREALADPEVEAALSVGRRPCGVKHPKLRELLLPDLFDFAAAEAQLAGWDACVWALGISSLGLDETAYAQGDGRRRRRRRGRVSPTPPPKKKPPPPPPPKPKGKGKG